VELVLAELEIAIAQQIRSQFMHNGPLIAPHHQVVAVVAVAVVHLTQHLHLHLQRQLLRQ
jgi:hypothetical protein